MATGDVGPSPAVGVADGKDEAGAAVGSEEARGE